jgi:cytochrome P450
VTDNI